MLSYWLLAHTFTGWEFVQACTFSTSVVYALGVQRHCCKNISFNINVYSTFNITFVTKGLTVTISNLVSSLTLSLCFQPTSNWDSFWWGFRLSGPYSLFSCFLKKWLRLSSAVDSFSGLPLFSCPTLYSNFQGNQACWHAWFLFTYSFGIILLL